MIRLLAHSLHRTDVRLRMPFRYGIATMTEGPVLFLRLEVDIDGHRWHGVASDLLPPKWFTKIPGKPIADEIAEMLQVIRHAATLATGRAGATAFEIWRGLYEDQLRWASAERIPPLLANFGVSLVERALIEAVCRASKRPFAQALQSNVLGIRLDALHAELGGAQPRDLLPAAPLARVLARHTVGLVDPLTDASIPAAERLDDGLPQSLESNIRAYGLRHFKVKVNGDLPRDLDRLRQCAEVFRREVKGDFAFSLDGNEQFQSIGQFREFWRQAIAHPDLAGFFDRLLFVEQPLHRDKALTPGIADEFRSWPGHPPVLIDESDATLADLPAALALGYAGTSHKNCKGIFKGVGNRCLIEHRRRAGNPGLRMSGEDLCNIGPVALLQDLAVMACLGIDSVERNGHQYHAGLSQFPAPVQESVLAAHPDLYRRSAAGWPTLRVENGSVDLGSINAAPFGVGFELDPGSVPRHDA